MGDLNKVAQTVSSGANVDSANDSGHTALIFAACNNHLSVVKFLVDAQVRCIRHLTLFSKQLIIHAKHFQADVDATDVNGFSVLFHACRWNKFDVLKYLVVEALADTSILDNLGKSVLTHAHELRLSHISKFILKYKVKFYLTRIIFRCSIIECVVGLDTDFWLRFANRPKLASTSQAQDRWACISTAVSCVLCLVKR